MRDEEAQGQFYTCRSHVRPHFFTGAKANEPGPVAMVADAAVRRGAKPQEVVRLS